MKNLFDKMGLYYPQRLLFIGSGITKTPEKWLSIPSIRTNSKTLGMFPDNEIFGIMTWPANIDDGLGGVLRHPRYRQIDPKPWIFMFDLNLSMKLAEGRFDPNARLFHLGVKERFESEAFAPYVAYSMKMGYEPRNSTGFYMILWLLYADVDEIYISGYDGYKALSGKEPGKWETKDGYKTINGTDWVPRDNNEIANRQNVGNPKDFFYHNLYTEWLAIKKAIDIARNRGVKIFVSKE